MTSPPTIFPEGFWDWEEEQREQWVEDWIDSVWHQHVGHSSAPRRTLEEQ